MWWRQLTLNHPTTLAATYECLDVGERFSLPDGDKFCMLQYIHKRITLAKFGHPGMSTPLRSTLFTAGNPYDPYIGNF